MNEEESKSNTSDPVNQNKSDQRPEPPPLPPHATVTDSFGISRKKSQDSLNKD